MKALFHKVLAVARLLFFLMLAVFLLAVSSKILVRKTYEGPWNYMAKLNEFYAMEENSLDYVGVGSSHMYCTLNPLEVWKDSGLKGFVLATPQQPITVSYYYLEEVFKTQSPRVVFVEALMAGVGTDDFHESFAHEAIDSMRFSPNKIRLINDLIPAKDRPEYWFNIIKYHSNWKEMDRSKVEEAFSNPEDFYKGFVCLENRAEFPTANTNYDVMGNKNLTERTLRVLGDICELTREHGAKLVILVAPYKASDDYYGFGIHTVRDWAEENGVEVVDITTMYDQVGLVSNQDFYDEDPHLNASGACKVSRYLSAYMLDGGLTPGDDREQEQWQQDYDRYYEALSPEMQQAVSPQ